MLRNIASQVIGSRQTPASLPVAPEAAASGLGGADFKKVRALGSALPSLPLLTARVHAACDPPRPLPFP